MINEKRVKKYCRDDISKIENYEQAINDKEHKWVCHHRLELTLDGEYAHSCNELKRLGMYFKRPYFELIFIRRDEHRKLHMINNKYIAGKSFSEFGRKFKEHYGISNYNNHKLYDRELHWYYSHNKVCRWEINNDK